MRNPLSALIGCADEIIASLRDYCENLRDSGNAVPLYSINEPVPNSQLLDESIEAANTIIYCAMHQKRIIDDILTLSRLDSNLLPVFPEPSEPVNLVKSAMKMFELELKRAGIRFDFVEQESLKSLGVQWTLLDPSRVLQVLINLMTNAIKFTRSLGNAQIKITIGASLSKPSDTNESGVKYIAKSDNSNSQDQTYKPEWGDGEAIYFNVNVKDTGCGLSTDEMDSLFRLFQQARWVLSEYFLSFLVVFRRIETPLRLQTFQFHMQPFLLITSPMLLMLTLNSSTAPKRMFSTEDQG